MGRVICESVRTGFSGLQLCSEFCLVMKILNESPLNNCTCLRPVANYPVLPTHSHPVVRMKVDLCQT